MQNKGITIILIVVLICFSFTLAQNGPFKKGSMRISQEFEFNSDGGDIWENHDGDRRSVINNQTGVGYFIMPGVSVGGQFLLERIAQGDYTNTMWGIGPSATYYLGADNTNGSVKGSVFPFASVVFAFLKGNEEYSSGGDFEFTATVFAGDVGAMYMLNSVVGFFGAASYQLWGFNSDEIPNDEENGNRFALQAGFAVFIH